MDNDTDLVLENQKLKKQIQAYKAQLKAYQDGFLFQDDLLNHHLISRQEEKLKQTIELKKKVSAEEIKNWLKEFKLLELDFDKVDKALKSILDNLNTIDISDTLEIQNKISQYVKLEDWNDQDQKNLQGIIFILSILYGTLTNQSQNDIPFIDKNA